MRAIIACWICMLLTCFCCAAEPQRVTVYPGSHVDRIKATYPSVYMVNEYLSIASVVDKSVKLDMEPYTGTGWAIASNGEDSVFVTAGHVCDKAGNIQIPDASKPPIVVVNVKMTIERHGVEYPAEILYVDHALDEDKCLLYVKGLAVKPLPLADSEPVEGDRVFYIGFPVQTESIVDGYYVTITGDNFAESSLAATGGASGSPVLNELGQVYGMLVRVNQRFLIDSYATRLHTLTPLLTRAREALSKP